MQTIANTNATSLSRQHTRLDHSHLPMAVSRRMPLASLLTITKEPEYAWLVFESFWKELLLPDRPPILFSLDGLSHIMRISDYRSRSFEPIHSHDLGLVRVFADALGGKTKFKNGAIIMGITTGSNAGRTNPSLNKAIEQVAAAQAGKEIPPRDPFLRTYDDRVFESMNGVDVFDIKGLSKPEARSLMEYWAASGILRMRVDERSVSEKWTTAGGGIVSQMEKVNLFTLRP